MIALLVVLGVCGDGRKVLPAGRTWAARARPPDEGCPTASSPAGRRRRSSLSSTAPPAFKRMRPASALPSVHSIVGFARILYHSWHDRQHREAKQWQQVCRLQQHLHRIGLMFGAEHRHTVADRREN